MEEPEQTYIPSQPMAIRGAEMMVILFRGFIEKPPLTSIFLFRPQSPSSVSQSLLEAVNLFSDEPPAQYGGQTNANFDSRMAAYQQSQQYGAMSVPGEWSGNQAASYYDPSTNGMLPYTNASYYSVSQPPNFNAAFAPPPLTFGARTHRFHPYSTSGARSYLPPVMQSPSKPTYVSPRARRLSL